jgi:hypothetical protein
MHNLHRSTEIAANSFQYHLETALSHGNNPPEFNFYQPLQLPQPSIKDLRKMVDKRVKEIELQRQAQLESLLTRTPMHANQDTDLLSPADLTQRRQRTRVRPTCNSSSEEPTPRRKRVKATSESPSEEADLLWAAPANTPGRSRQRLSAFPSLLPQPQEPPPTAPQSPMPILEQPKATVPFYSRHTVIVCKETLHVYVIVAYSAEHDHYEYISLYQPNWHTVLRSSYTLTLPDPDFPVLGHAMDNTISSKLFC